MRLRLALLTAAAVLVAAPAFAQPAAPPAGPDARGRHAEGRWEGMRARMESHRRQEAADLSTVLRLKADQQGALQAWLDASRPKWDGPRPGMDRAPPSTPETTAQKLDQEQARMSERETRAKARLDATRRFYASLSPEQQTVFDALQRLHHGPHGGGRWGHGGRGMGAPGPMGAPPPRGEAFSLSPLRGEGRGEGVSARHLTSALAPPPQPLPARGRGLKPPLPDPRAGPAG